MTDRTPGRSAAPAPPGRGAVRAPLLAVVGGPTGAGKSTLLNSLVRAPVSAAGVLRPTTRRPVLVCNPHDWASVRRHGLRPICAPLIPEGIAVVDAPDVDSIEAGNRTLTAELFAEADLWLFVTTASRYADAAAWRHLRAARARRVALAIVLDRIGAGHAPGIVNHMRDLLGPPEPPLFVIPEAPLDRQGMLPESIAAPLRGWLAEVVHAARFGPPAPPQPAIGIASVPARNIARPGDPTTHHHIGTPVGTPQAADGPGGDTGLTVELELIVAQPHRSTGPGTAASLGTDTATAGDAAAEGVAATAGVPDTDAVGDVAAQDPSGARAADADGVPRVVESDPPDGRPDQPLADIPKAADVGETVKL